MTAREEEPESIHTSSVSLDLVAASVFIHFFGRTRDQISAALGLSKPARMLVRVGIVENYPAAVSVRRSVLDVMAS